MLVLITIFWDGICFCSGQVGPLLQMPFTLFPSFTSLRVFYPSVFYSSARANVGARRERTIRLMLAAVAAISCPQRTFHRPR